ncbi:hypothetical protein V0288_12195 [Pannus brasiliensis CCIBt3594]|uniref:Uncharacterized protein n=1 Tax=Pannus brasiliensis CCIBt3594 TaxID=1427578 RepID=A0AAW9QYC2_9CHRO
MNTEFSQPENAKDPPTEERLARLTGFDDPSLASHADRSRSSSSSPTPLLPEEDLEEQITRHSFASSPLSKLVFVSGAVFFVVFVASLFLSRFQSPGESVAANRPVETGEQEKNPLLSPANEDKEKSRLLSELALREQQERLRDIQERKNQPFQPIAAEKPRTRSVIASRPPTRTVSVSPRPVSREIGSEMRSPADRPIPRTVRVPPQRSVRPVATTPARSLPTPRPIANEDPSELWSKLSRVGSFEEGSVSSSSPSSRQSRTAPVYEPRTVRDRVNSSEQVISPDRSRDRPIASNPSPPNNDPRAIEFGQSIPARLETTIAWEGERRNRTERASDERYLLTLNEPLTDKSGNVRIPAGSKAIARLETGNNALVTLSVESLVIDGKEIPLPEGALKVRGAGGQPLVAEMKTLGNNGSDDNARTITDLLSIAGDFADIPGGRSISSLYRMLTGGENRRLGSGVSVTIFFLRQGTPLEVFVNRTFGVDIPEKPLELDLGAIDSPDRRIPLEATDTVLEEGK